MNHLLNEKKQSQWLSITPQYKNTNISNNMLTLKISITIHLSYFPAYNSNKHTFILTIAVLRLM